MMFCKTSTQLVRSIVLLLILAGFASCCQTPASTSESVKIDSARISLGDAEKHFLRSKAIDSIKVSWANLLQDTTKLKKDTVLKAFKLLDEAESYYGKLIAEKNLALFSTNRSLAACVGREKPLVWVLIIIVIATGILGGVAGPRFNLLTTGEEIEKAIAEAKAELNNNKSKLDQLKQTALTNAPLQMSESFQSTFTEAANDVSTAQQQLDELEKERERKFAYVIFGVIAAALSFVALSFFDSKILEFNTTVDYFVFSGYSLLGAIFAKKWILQLYELISKGKQK